MFAVAPTRRKRKAVSLRRQLVLLLVGLVALSVGLSVTVGSATITNRYVGHLRMQQMHGAGMELGEGEGTYTGPGVGPGMGPGAGIGMGMGMGPGRGPTTGPGRRGPAPAGPAAGVAPRLSWWESLQRGVESVVGSNRATAGLGFTQAENDLLHSLNLGMLQAGAVVLVLAVAAGLLLARRLAYPIGAIEAAVHRLQASETADMAKAAMPEAVQPGGMARQTTPNDRLQPVSLVPESVIRRAPAELAALAESFNQMAVKLADARRQRQNIVADVAHELRTPVSALRSYAEAVWDGVLPANKAAWRTVLDQTLQLSRLVEDLMQLALWETGQLQLRRQPVNMVDLVNKVVDVYRPSAADQGITLLWSPPVDGPTGAIPQVGTARPEAAARQAGAARDGRGAAGLPSFVAQADGERLAQVLHNLLTNALRHTAPGGRVKVTIAHASGTPQANAPEIEMAVANTGPAIPPEQLERLFERFYRGDPSRSRPTGGAGLGLTIAREIVQAHGGRIWAANGPDGPVFRVRIPVS
ncbi:MAG: HAMP domain-containing histidine kinase [Limnochordaceae bacterium]|nr:HAMP domain-containing histidine kinase [Limnochordaceae bacterium]